MAVDCTAQELHCTFLNSQQVAACTSQHRVLAEGARASAATFLKDRCLSAGTACENISIAARLGGIDDVLENRQRPAASTRVQQMPLPIAAARSHI